MGTWGEVLAEIQKRRAGPEGPHVFDNVRKESIQALAGYTGRSVIVYAVAHLQRPGAGQLISITHEDMEGFMEVIHGLPDGGLDLILHSPGGVPEAAEAIMRYLRSKFDDIRVIVPHMAMSAATMMACGAKRVMMARHSQLGPIDPQLVMQTDVGVQMVPAWAILEQFEQAKREAKDQTTLSAWYPIIKQYGPALLTQCRNAIDYSEDFVSEFLATGMLADRGRHAKRAAKRAAKKLNHHMTHHTHGRPLGRDYLRDTLGFVIEELEAYQEMQDRVLTVYHAFMLTFVSTTAAKIIENNMGRRYVKILNTPAAPQPAPAPQAGP